MLRLMRNASKRGTKSKRDRILDVAARRLHERLKVGRTAWITLTLVALSMPANQVVSGCGGFFQPSNQQQVAPVAEAQPAATE